MTEEEYLEHVGVKGMKWGKRKAQNDAIKSARAKTELMRTQYNQLARDLNLRTKYDPKGRDPLTKIAAKKLNDHVNIMSKNEADLVTAQKMLTGEKVATGIVVGAIGATAIASLALKIAR